MPLTNFTRHKMLGPLCGTTFTDLSPLYVSLFTALPTTDGTSGGGVLDETEWAAARKVWNAESGGDPECLRQSGDNGGHELTLGSGQITWSTSDTAVLPSDATVVGYGIYDALTTGNLVAYHEFPTPRVVPVGGVFTFDTDKIKIRMFKDLTE